MMREQREGPSHAICVYGCRHWAAWLGIEPAGVPPWEAYGERPRRGGTKSAGGGTTEKEGRGRSV